MNPFSIRAKTLARLAACLTVAVGLLALHARPGPALAVAGWGFVVGAVIFSGSLYALVLSGIRWLGAITPLGGVAFLVGWLALAVAATDAARSWSAEVP